MNKLRLLHLLSFSACVRGCVPTPVPKRMCNAGICARSRACVCVRSCLIEGIESGEIRNIEYTRKSFRTVPKMYLIQLLIFC